jgi:hypothetical protein
MLSVELACQGTQSRKDLWTNLVARSQTETMCEVGVWRGEFAEHVLRTCDLIREYIMIDPWKNLDNWNKPFNVSDDLFQEVKAEAIRRTDFARDRRKVLQGTTVEVASSLRDGSLDMCYIDGDHTLRGITIDLIRMYPKVRDGGLIGGDDFLHSAWQHNNQYEPTLVFPQALYFAEATGSVIYGLPHNQFALLVDRSRDAFEFRDLTGMYSAHSVQTVLKLQSTERGRSFFQRVWEKVAGK